MIASSLPQLLGIKLPIIQGPFGGKFSTVRLTAAVSNEGALGSFGAQAFAPEKILETAKLIREATSRPFAMNLWMSLMDPAATTISSAEYERCIDPLRPFFDELGVIPPPLPKTLREVVPSVADQIAAVLEARPAVFSFVFGIPPKDVLVRCRTLGIVTAGAATTVAEAQAMADAGVDIVVASGLEAGGHRPSFLRSAEESLVGTLPLVAQAVDAVQVPVVAAGGIADARGIRAALALGAAAAQIGTAFLACEESGASATHREKLFSAEAQETVLTRAFSGRLGRAIVNRYTREFRGEPAPYPLQGWILWPLAQAIAADGRYELGHYWSGQAAGLLRHRAAIDLIGDLKAAFD